MRTQLAWMHYIHAAKMHRDSPADPYTLGISSFKSSIEEYAKEFLLSGGNLVVLNQGVWCNPIFEWNEM